jgi:hypothetical protein
VHAGERERRSKMADESEGRIWGSAAGGREMDQRRPKLYDDGSAWGPGVLRVPALSCGGLGGLGSLIVALSAAARICGSSLPLAGGTGCGDAALPVHTWARPPCTWNGWPWIDELDERHYCTQYLFAQRTGPLVPDAVVCMVVHHDLTTTTPSRHGRALNIAPRPARSRHFPAARRGGLMSRNSIGE